MKAYRVSAKLKIGLILFAIVIAVVSLAYTHQLVNRLKDREQSVVRLWANALVQLPKAQLQSVNPYQAELSEIQGRLRAMPSAGRVFPQIGWRPCWKRSPGPRACRRRVN